jgi:hypothetical protein
MKEILDGVDQGWVCPYVSKTFPFSDVGQAHSYIEALEKAAQIEALILEKGCSRLARPSQSWTRSRKQGKD